MKLKTCFIFYATLGEVSIANSYGRSKTVILVPLHYDNINALFPLFSTSKKNWQRTKIERTA